MRTAIVGLGHIGATVARNLTTGGAHIIVADRSLAKAEALANELGAAAEATSVDTALDTADVIILAVYLDALKELILSHHAALAGKIVVDPSNPIAPDGKGGFTKTIPAAQSSGQIVASMLPEGAELVKAFGTLGAESLATAANRVPERAVLFYATDYPEAARVVAGLIEKSGFSPVLVGGLQECIRLEVGGDLHEFGKLGRLVSAAEADIVLRSGSLGER